MKRLLLPTLGLSALALLFVVAHAVGNQPVNYQTQTAIAAPYVSPTASDVAYQVNMQRIKYGLPALTDDPKLDAAAAAHCDDMATLRYYAHNRPDGTPPWHFITEQSVVWGTAGENIALGRYAALSVTNAWMLSPEHRDNILKNSYTTEGTAVCDSQGYLGVPDGLFIVQFFVGL